MAVIHVGGLIVCKLNPDSVAPNAASFVAIALVQVKRTAVALEMLGNKIIPFVPTVWPATLGSRFKRDHWKEETAWPWSI